MWMTWESSCNCEGLGSPRAPVLPGPSSACQDRRGTVEDRVSQRTRLVHRVWHAFEIDSEEIVDVMLFRWRPWQTWARKGEVDSASKTKRPTRKDAISYKNQFRMPSFSVFVIPQSKSVCKGLQTKTFSELDWNQLWIEERIPYYRPGNQGWSGIQNHGLHPIMQDFPTRKFWWLYCIRILK